MRKTYKIIIEETISDEFAVTASSEEGAVKTAIERYKSGELVLSPGNLLEKKIAVITDNGDTSDRMAF